METALPPSRSIRVALVWPLSKLSMLVVLPNSKLSLKRLISHLQYRFSLCHSTPTCLLQLPSYFVSPDGTPVLKGRSRVRRPLVAEDEFKALKLDNAAYAMDQVLSLPLSTALKIHTIFYPPGANNAIIPTLCRLYFDKALDGHPNRFFNSAIWMYPGIASCWTLPTVTTTPVWMRSLLA